MSGCGLQTAAPCGLSRSVDRVRGRLGVLALAGALALAAAPAASAHGSEAAASPPGKRLARGLVYRGLERAEPGTPCAGTFQLLTRNGKVACSHGPDPAPQGLDVQRRRSVAALLAAEGDGGTAASDGPSTAASGDQVPCTGDGTSGSRALAIYAVEAGTPDRYEQVAPLIRGWAAEVDGVVNASALETGGSRHVRFVTDADCRLVVERVVLSATGADSFNNTADELAALGYTRSDRKYLVWVDANVYCGIASLWYDDRPTPDNLNNGRTGVPGMVARVDNGCWGYAETHELVHTLGGVQDSAPNASGYGHCTDEGDEMCYADGPGVVMRQVCPVDHERLLDCNHDDYFHTAPSAGSYLATHWNTARSSFLTADAADAVAPALTAPAETFGGRIGFGSVPVRVRWSAADASGVASTLWRSIDGGGYVNVPVATATATSAVHELRPGHRYRFRVDATDGAGNTASAEGATFVVRSHEETSGAISYAGGWKRRSWSYASGGYERHATAAGARARLSFTGRSVAWVTRVGPGSGRAYLFVDDAYVTTVDLYARTVGARRVLFSRGWPASAPHTLTVVVAGTPKRPRVDVDAFVVLR